MLYLLTSVLAILGHGQQEPAHVPVRFGMTMREVFDAFGEPFEDPGRLRSSHGRAIDWLGGEEVWTVYYDFPNAAVVAWERKYYPLDNPPSWLRSVVNGLGLRERMSRFFPPITHTYQAPSSSAIRGLWKMGEQ